MKKVKTTVIKAPNSNLPDAIIIDTGRKPSIEEIKEQLWRDAMNDDLIFDDEIAFLRHLLRKWGRENGTIE